MYTPPIKVSLMVSYVPFDLSGAGLQACPFKSLALRGIQPHVVACAEVLSGVCLHMYVQEGEVMIMKLLYDTIAGTDTCCPTTSH